ERLATGHYARIVIRDGGHLLARAADAGKDQSYMLGRLDPRLLDRLWFPLGEQTKEETRAEAERARLRVARRPESQEACFLAAATTATSWPATGSSPPPARSSTSTARSSARITGSGGSRPGSAAGSA